MAEYTANDDATVTVSNSAWRPLQGWTNGKAAAVVADTGDASLIVSFTGKTPDPSDKANYTVLDTDYETYSVVYSCGSALDLVSFDFLWILAREKELDDAAMMSIVTKIEDTLPNYHFWSNHQMTHQGRLCPYDSRPE